MVIERRSGDILNGDQRRIAFAVNCEGINDAGFAGMISRRFWPELANIGPTELGTVLTKKVDGYEFFALCCHSLDNGWNNQQETIRKCFDSIPGDDPVASIAIGTGLIGVLTGANFTLIKAGMEESKAKIILY